jgi:hypothetical protein
MTSAIEHYEQAGDRLKTAIAGLTDDDLLWKPPADAGIGLWSIHELIIHLMDSDLIGIDRMKRIIAEENPTLIGYNESLFAKNLFYSQQPVHDAVTIIDLSRRMFAGVLGKLPQAAWSRIGQHNEAGQVTLETQLKKYNEHFDHHLGFVHKKRAAMGKEMW